ncbi:hypothetical protein [Spiribacter onubensis]|uniref:Uncharacterized protein n=2 Tax=Spiribacter onubensis TaxID=3122420 RepID=A0ABV3S8D4_9GAMM
MAMPAVNASCLAVDGNERLTNYCLSARSADAAIPLDLAKVIDARIKYEGYDDGLGFEQVVAPRRFSPLFMPFFEYERNINGGNPAEPLELGNVTLIGDPDLERKDGLVYGAGVGLAGRWLVGEGRYLDYSAIATRREAVDHNLNIDGRFLSICSKNHIGSWRYIDACARRYGEEKRLSDAEVDRVTVSLSQMLSSNGRTHHIVSLEPGRIITDDYRQNQIRASLETVYGNGSMTNISFLYGEDKDAHVATRHQARVGYQGWVAGLLVGLTATRSETNETTFLGYERADRTDQIMVKFSLSERVDLELGYTKSDSTINFFDYAGFTGGLSISPFFLGGD